MPLSALETQLVRLSLPATEPACVELPPRAAARLTEMAARHSVLPIVVRNLGQPAPDDLVSAAGFAVLLRLRLDEIARTLRARAVPFVVLKGAEFADRLYPDPALRGFTDIDLMVRRDALAAVGEALQSLEYEHCVPKGLSHIEPYGEQLWQPVGPGKFGVEIHWNLVNSPPVQRGVSVVFEDLQRDSSGRLSAASLLLIAAVHGAASHQFDRLGLLVDVRQAAMVSAGTVDEAYLVETATRTGGRLALVTALTLAHRFWGDAECARLRDLFPWRPMDAVAQQLITPGLVLRPATRATDLRRRLFRELLKRR
jgi:hypothetical protein